MLLIQLTCGFETYFYSYISSINRKHVEPFIITLIFDETDQGQHIYPRILNLIDIVSSDVSAALSRHENICEFEIGYPSLQSQLLSIYEVC